MFAFRYAKISAKGDPFTTKIQIKYRFLQIKVSFFRDQIMVESTGENHCFTNLNKLKDGQKFSETFLKLANCLL
jgi:hypothetical protein